MAATATASPRPASVFFDADSIPARAGAANADSLVPVDGLDVDSMGELKGLIERETLPVAPGARTWRTSKNPRVAMLCALLVPGLGQMYNERPFKALVAGGAEMYYLLQVRINHRKARREILERDAWIASQDSLTSSSAARRLASYDFWIGEYRARKTDWLWWSAGALVVIVLDAYIDAHLHDMTFEVAPLPREEGAVLAVGLRF